MRSEMFRDTHRKRKKYIHLQGMKSIALCFENMQRQYAGFSTVNVWNKCSQCFLAFSFDTSTVLIHS